MTDRYVAVGGGTGAGTIGDPWSLAHALSGASGALQPSDTVWMRGGVYQQATAFVQSTVGTLGGGVDDPNGKIRWSNYPGELVEIESTNTGDVECLHANGSYNWWWATVGQNEGLVFRRSWAENPRNSARGSTVWVKDVPQNGNKFIHIVCRDGDAGFYMGNSAGNDFRYGNMELYGPITYNCGHGLMTQHNYYLRHSSPSGEILTVNGAIGFNSCSQGMQIYSQDPPDGLQGIRVTNCIQFNSGVLGDGSTTTSSFVFVSGVTTAFVKLKDFKALDLVGYHPAGVTGNRRPFSVGETHATDLNEDVEVARGYWVGGNLGVRQGVFRLDGVSLNFHDNYYNPRAAVQVLQQEQAGSLTGYAGWETNEWRRDPTATAWMSGGTSRNKANWTTSTGLGGSDTTPSADPTVNKVFVFPLTKYNHYAHVCFFNWESSGTVAVNLASLLNVGDGYEVYNVQDLFGAPVLSDTYAGGTVDFPTTGKTPPTPVGVLPRSAPTTAPFFDTFLVRRTSIAAVATAPTQGGGPPPPARVYILDMPPKWKPKMPRKSPKRGKRK